MEEIPTSDEMSSADKASAIRELEDAKLTRAQRLKLERGEV